MNGPQHWEEADLIVTGESCDHGCPHTGCKHELARLARAQVHATLALAAATTLGAGDWEEWVKAIRGPEAAL